VALRFAPRVFAFGVVCAALGVGVAACGDARVDASLDVDDVDGGATEIRGHWQYESGEVDVDIDVVTAEGSACATVARLVVDKALATRDIYHLHAECSTLRLSEAGDLVLFDAPTGHDWTHEAIEVDSDREQIALGPWQDETSGDTYRFVLSAPECADDDDCNCPRLTRTKNRETAQLDLGRRCD
jgi:hypothetical protein